MPSYWPGYQLVHSGRLGGRMITPTASTVVSQAAPAVLFLWLELRASWFCLQPLMDTALGQSKGFLRLLYNPGEARRGLRSTQSHRILPCSF